MKDEWTDAYSLIMPLLGVAITALGVSLSLIMLRSQAQAVGGLEPQTGVAVQVPRVRYYDSEVDVEVRDPGEWHSITSFVQPYNPRVRQLVQQII